MLLNIDTLSLNLTQPRELDRRSPFYRQETGPERESDLPKVTQPGCLEDRVSTQVSLHVGTPGSPSAGISSSLEDQQGWEECVPESVGTWAWRPPPTQQRMCNGSCEKLGLVLGEEASGEVHRGAGVVGTRAVLGLRRG